MQLNPLRTDAGYRIALLEIEGLMTAKSGTGKGEHLAVLATLVEAYETRHYPIAPPPPPSSTS